MGIDLLLVRCVIEELKSLGSSHVESFLAARKDYKLARLGFYCPFLQFNTASNLFK